VDAAFSPNLLLSTQSPARAVAINPYIAQFTLAFLNILTWAIIARSLISFFPIDQSSPLFQMLHRVTEPIVEPFRRIMPQTGMLDFSPMMAVISLIVLQSVVASLAQPF
jgi:YggT family protein